MWARFRHFSTLNRRESAFGACHSPNGPFSGGIRTEAPADASRAPPPIAPPSLEFKPGRCLRGRVAFPGSHPNSRLPYPAAGLPLTPRNLPNPQPILPPARSSLLRPFLRLYPLYIPFSSPLRVPCHAPPYTPNCQFSRYCRPWLPRMHSEGGPIAVYQCSPWDHPLSSTFSPARAYRVCLCNCRPIQHTITSASAAPQLRVEVRITPTPAGTSSLGGL